MRGTTLAAAVAFLLLLEACAPPAESRFRNPLPEAGVPVTEISAAGIRTYVRTPDGREVPFNIPKGPDLTKEEQARNEAIAMGVPICFERSRGPDFRDPIFIK